MRREVRVYGPVFRRNLLPALFKAEVRKWKGQVLSEHCRSTTQHDVTSEKFIFLVLSEIRVATLSTNSVLRYNFGFEVYLSP
jgi:hypothetical protein